MAVMPVTADIVVLEVGCGGNGGGFEPRQKGLIVVVSPTMIMV